MTNSVIEVHRISAFTYEGSGGNPAGAAILPCPVKPEVMQFIARDVGYAETAFLCQQNGSWTIRYFSPEIEVPFCGHATIASGALLGEIYGQKAFNLTIGSGEEVSVISREVEDGIWLASLQSPRTFSSIMSEETLATAMRLFGLKNTDLDPVLRPRIISAGANHLLLGIATRERLSTIGFSFDLVRSFQHTLNLATVSLIHAESRKLFHARNAFPIGGLYEDPATGAAAAALAGYLRDIEWPFDGEFDVIQGEDIGQKSLIHVQASAKKGSSVKVSGRTTKISSPLEYPIEPKMIAIE